MNDAQRRAREDAVAELAAGAYQLGSAADLLSLVFSSSVIALDRDTLVKLDTANDLIKQVEAHFRGRYEFMRGRPNPT